jgi:hypothetical protein
MRDVDIEPQEKKCTTKTHKKQNKANCVQQTPARKNSRPQPNHSPEKDLHISSDPAAWLTLSSEGRQTERWAVGRKTVVVGRRFERNRWTKAQQKTAVADATCSVADPKAETALAREARRQTGHETKRLGPSCH